jgi:hypothetical protein
MCDCVPAAFDSRGAFYAMIKRWRVFQKHRQRDSSSSKMNCLMCLSAMPCEQTLDVPSAEQQREITTAVPPLVKAHGGCEETETSAARD